MIYFDNASTTFPKPDFVIDYMCDYYKNNGFNAGRGQYEGASFIQSMIEQTRYKILELFHSPKDKNVIFTPSATIALNISLQGLDWSENENVYVTHFEHNAVLRTLNAVNKKTKLNIHKLYVERETLTYDLEKIKVQFEKNSPDKIIMTHISNVCGLITPIEDICKLAEKYNTKIIIDGSQSCGLIDIDLRKINPDCLIFAGHKTLYSSFGVAGLILKSDTNIKTFIYGGTGIDSANEEMPKELPYMLEAGSLNVPAIASLNKSLEFIQEIKIENIYEKEKSLKKLLIKCLSEFKNIKLFIPKDIETVTGIISCTFNGYSSDNIGNVLNDNDIAVRTGLQCSPECHKFLGTFPSGTVRFSLSYFNSENDINELHRVIKFIADNS